MGLPKDKVIISVSIDSDVKELLLKYSKEIDLPLSKFVRNLIYVSLDDFKLLKKGGCISISKYFRDTVEAYIKHEGIKEFLLGSKDKKPVTISVVVDRDIKEQLDEYADYLGLTLNIFGRNLIYVGLDGFQILKKAGFVKLAKLSSAFKIFVKSYVNEEANYENDVSL